MRTFILRRDSHPMRAFIPPRRLAAILVLVILSMVLILYDLEKKGQKKWQQKPKEEENWWSWRLDKAQLQKCQDLKTKSIDKYSRGRSHEKERPFPSFVPSFSPIPNTNTTANSSTTAPDSIPEYSSKEAEAMISCLQDLNKRSLEDLKTSLSISNGNLKVRPIIPIVVICHNRDKYLRHNIQSLIANIGIEETVIIFSHDGYFPSIQEVIHEVMSESRVKGLNIRYVQFFFPFSRTWLSHSFFLHLPFFKPGLAKHHYYWMWNYMFDVVLPSSQDVFKWPDDEMFVTTIEEDHVVTMDFYQVNKLMIEVLKPMQDKKDPVFVFSAGLMEEDSYLDPSRLGDFEYDTIQNAGLTLSRKMFLKIRNAGKAAVSIKPEDLSNNFKVPTTWCNFNEYNWDCALFRMSQEFVPGISIVPVIKRVAHIGSCGMHFKATSCDGLFPKINATLLQPLNDHILKHPSSPLNLGLFFTNPENHTLTEKMDLKHYERPDRAIQFKSGRFSARSMDLFHGYQGWLSASVSPETKVSEIQADNMLQTDGLEWYSPFNELLCKRIENE